MASILQMTYAFCGTGDKPLPYVMFIPIFHVALPGCDELLCPLFASYGILGIENILGTGDTPEMKRVLSGSQGIVYCTQLDKRVFFVMASPLIYCLL